MKHLLDVTSIHQSTREVLQFFADSSRKQSLDSLPKEEQIDLILDLAGNLALYGEAALGLPGKTVARAAEAAVDPAALDEAVIPAGSNIRSYISYVERTRGGGPGGRGA